MTDPRNNYPLVRIRNAETELFLAQVAFVKSCGWVDCGGGYWEKPGSYSSRLLEDAISISRREVGAA